MFEKRWFQTLVAFILVFLLILLISYADFVFEPIRDYLIAVAVPFVGAGVLYYLTKPVVSLLEKFKFPKILAIISVFLLILFVLYLFTVFIVPVAQSQIEKLIDNTPKMVDTVQDIIIYWQSDQNILPAQVESTIENLTNNLQTYIEGLTTFIFDFVGQLFGFLFAVVLVPFFLFFMLKDGEKFVPFITQFMSHNKSESFRRLMGNINHTLTAYIQGQLIVSFCVGVLLYIGYQIIGLDYVLTLSLFAMLTNIIPFIGPFLAVIPAVLVAFFQDPFMVVYVLIVMVAAQQLEGNLISPNIMGKALELHPLTIITLVLSAGSIAGFLGLLFVIPAYAVIKTIISHFYHEWKKKQPADEQDLIH
ncbi:AI-2E family transporter [Aquibacillus sp. 3ASR75-11]|uniref:AI-2E family transporter n=1 Tax=Terrihalobacillus insolitus TaxID=2950438 RepID=A0A9X4AMV3_9BACI|nr:AI-2E family transporter [Terrihalobacillus insolitus]MDC3414583.1 AI-2E family transporter [Terrihalobacillus insolitus]MDC3425741.1 AI-2E family transporter [Terrihalobacillus insolitus]